MFKSLYAWTLEKAGHRHAPWWLAFFSFVESSVFPTPPDPVLAVMVLAKRQHVIRLVVNCTVSSVVGGLLGYAIGYYLFESIGRPILEWTHAMGQFAVVQNCFNHYGALIILIKGLTPIPYKLITITAGLTKLDLVTFTVASAISRGTRFAAVGAAMYWVDSPIGLFLRRHLRLTLAISLGAVIAIVAYVYYAPGGPICG
jgi:membrane protein YqaA with SNARE-associated domain